MIEVDDRKGMDFAAKFSKSLIDYACVTRVPYLWQLEKTVFGYVNQHGLGAVHFYKRTNTITSRWPTGIKEGAGFSVPTMG
jgi:hypothetical protein